MRQRLETFCHFEPAANFCYTWSTLETAFSFFPLRACSQQLGRNPEEKFVCGNVCFCIKKTIDSDRKSLDRGLPRIRASKPLFSLYSYPGNQETGDHWLLLGTPIIITPTQDWRLLFFFRWPPIITTPTQDWRLHIFFRWRKKMLLGLKSPETSRAGCTTVVVL